MEARIARINLGNDGATFVQTSVRRMTRAARLPPDLIRVAAGALCVLPFRHHHLIIFVREWSERDADAERGD